MASNIVPKVNRSHAVQNVYAPHGGTKRNEQARLRGRMSDEDGKKLSSLLFTRHRSTVNLSSLHDVLHGHTYQQQLHRARRCSADEDSGRGDEGQRLLGVQIDGYNNKNSNGKSPGGPSSRSANLLKRTLLLPQNWSQYFKSEQELRKIKKKNVRKFYESQNILIGHLEKVDQMLESPASAQKINQYSLQNQRDDSEDLAQDDLEVQLHHGVTGGGGGDFHRTSQRVVRLAIYINFLANFLLLAAKGFIAISTNSLSMTASLVDSALDFTSTIIVFTVSRLIAHRSSNTTYIFPVGKNRLEPIGVLVFAVIMIVSFVQVIGEAVKHLLHAKQDNTLPEIIHLTPIAVFTMLLTVVIKGLCWVWCRKVKDSGVRALAQDAMNDVIFNLASLAFPLVGTWLTLWWADDVGAILISVYIIFEWCQTAAVHVQQLTGMSAELVVLQTIVYLAARFSDHILQVPAVSAYHAGDNLLVEVDIVLSETMSLRDVHDLSEALQFNIESLPMVERAFVHSGNGSDSLQS